MDKHIAGGTVFHKHNFWFTYQTEKSYVLMLMLHLLNGGLIRHTMKAMIDPYEQAGLNFSSRFSYAMLRLFSNA